MTVLYFEVPEFLDFKYETPDAGIQSDLVKMTKDVVRKSDRDRDFNSVGMHHSGGIPLFNSIP